MSCVASAQVAWGLPESSAATSSGRAEIFLYTVRYTSAMMGEKVCWVCRRTEGEIVKDLGEEQYAEAREVYDWRHNNWVGVEICPVCRDMISSHEAGDDFASYICTIFEEEILPRLSVKMTPQYKIMLAEIE